jgi:hypothetical protein
MKRPILLGLSALLGAALSSAAADQACGTSVFGGAIPKGSYAGSGTTEQGAKNDLADDMGLQKPECEQCEGSGCDSTTHINGAKNITYTFPHQDPITGLWTAGAQVTADGVTWDAICTSCN